VVGISGPGLVQSQKQIINKTIVIGFGSFRQVIQNMWLFALAKSVIITFGPEIDGRTLGVTSAGEKANIASDLID
jgi:hypothetical protein